jgi:hypothetical protein
MSHLAPIALLKCAVLRRAKESQKSLPIATKSEVGSKLTRETHVLLVMDGQKSPQKRLLHYGA